ncbi:MAG TPA: substrate-binding domain-containing protein [Solirubrobacteraceae bacterium]|nr:substrate-binding domain-containing protein [Solirubrobacteraceae bacterium]
MADEDIVHDAIERLEWDERKEEETPLQKFRQMTRRTALTGSAAAVAAMVLEACGSSKSTSSAATTSSASGAGVFGTTASHHFVMVNHVTTNSFFTATIYGCQDACALTGSSFTWTGSTDSIIGQMVSAFNAGIAAKANGIGCPLIDNTAFNSPVDTALGAGIPVIAYNADVSAGVKNNRMAYIGQNNLTAGAAVGQAILKSGKVSSGDLVAGIIATPGTGNIQPRLDGAKPILDAAGVKFVEVGTSATEGSPEYDKISAWYAGNKDVKWMMAVDSGDSNAVAQFIKNEGLAGKVGASVWDVGLPVVQAINAGYVTATIDQQAYLQGFDTIMQLYLWNVSGGLMRPTDTDTGIGIVTKANVAPYLVPSRFEGTSSAKKALTPPSSISV